MKKEIKSPIKLPLLTLKKSATQISGVDLDTLKIGDKFCWKVVDFDKKEQSVDFILEKIEDSSEGVERVKFSDCFKKNWDGSLETKRKIKVNSLILNKNVKIGEGLLVGGINFLLFSDKDISVIKELDCWIIKGFYSN